MPSFSAVLLAGGKSQRMGRDKALLPLPGSGELLWQRQLRVLKEVRPERIFWSGPARPGLPDDLSQVPDAVPNVGPLGGVCSCLRAAATDLLIVLAVDLPQMDADYLRKLARRCTPQRGAVPQRGDDFEPLAAIYPTLLRDLADDRLRQGRYAMHDFVREAIRRELLEAVPIGDEDAAKFVNVNLPEEWAALEDQPR